VWEVVRTVAQHWILFRFKNARTRWDFDFQGGDVSRKHPDASAVSHLLIF
jgi:hypothetical protein